MKLFYFNSILLLPLALISQDDVSEVGSLPQQIWETSGLIFHNGKLITHNDSGNTPQLFEMDTTSLQITRTVTIANATNTDWEDIAQDSDYIYIGDIGNNLGDRQDLNILKIAKSDYEESDTVTAERIDYIYENQNDFTTTQNSDWDAEALFVLGEDLIVLTKQWQSQGTVAYRVPKLPGAFLAERIDSNQINGLVTGADYDSDNNKLHIVGYSTFLTPFFVEIEGVQENSILSGLVTKTDLNIGIAQTEALTQVGNTFYVSSEEFSNTTPPITSASRLFRFTLNSEDEEPGGGDGGEPNPETPSVSDNLILYRSFGSRILNYNLNLDAPIFGMGIFDSVGRLIQFTPLEHIRGTSVDLSELGPSIYHLAFFYGDAIISKPFILD